MKKADKKSTHTFRRSLTEMLHSKWRWLFYGIYAISVIGIFADRIFPAYDGDRVKFYFVLVLLLMLGITGWLVAGTDIGEKRGNRLSGDYGKTFAILVLAWGLVATLALPMSTVIDGDAHYGTVYAFSNVLLGENEKNTDGKRSVSVRTADAGISSATKLDRDLYQTVAEGSWGLVADDGSRVELQDSVVRSLGSSQYGRYLASGLGFTLARLLHLGQMSAIFLAKLFNILFFAFAGWLSLKLLPRGGQWLAFLAMLPQAWQTYGSLHYDGQLIACLMVFTAYTLHLAEQGKNSTQPAGAQQKLRWWQLLLWLALWLTLVPQKYVYAGFGLLIFLIPMEQWKKIFCNWPRRILGIALVILGTLCGAYFLGGKIAYALNNPYEMGIGELFAHPGRTLVALLGSFAPTYLYTDLLYVIGKLIGFYQIYLPAGLLLLFAVLFGLLIYESRYENCDRKPAIAENEKYRRQRWIVILITALVILLLMLVSLMSRLDRIQPVLLAGRQSLPYIWGLLMACGSRTEAKDTVAGIYAIESMCLTFAVCNILVQAVNM